jgi:spermidine synthase
MGAVYRRTRGASPSRVEVRVGRGGRSLRIDGTFASWYAPGMRPTGSVWDALAVPLLLLPPARRRSILVLGLGGGSAARIARVVAPRARIVGVEVDPEVVRAARRWFDLDELGIEVVVGDALATLRRSRRRYDAIIEDVFVGSGRAVHKPEWLPLPGLALAAARLAPGGLLISNAIDEAPAVARAMRALRPQLLEISVEDYDNRILVGAPRSASGRMLRASVAAHPLLGSAVERLRFRTLPRRSGRRSGT